MHDAKHKHADVVGQVVDMVLGHGQATNTRDEIGEGRADAGERRDPIKRIVQLRAVRFCLSISLLVHRVGRNLQEIGTSHGRESGLTV